MSCALTLSPHHPPYSFDLTYTVVLMSLSHGLCTILSYPPSVLSSLSYTAPTRRTSCSHASRFGFGPCFRCMLPQIFTTTSVFRYWAIHTASTSFLALSCALASLGSVGSCHSVWIGRVGRFSQFYPLSSSPSRFGLSPSSPGFLPDQLPHSHIEIPPSLHLEPTARGIWSI